MNRLRLLTTVAAVLALGAGAALWLSRPVGGPTLEEAPAGPQATAPVPPPPPAVATIDLVGGEGTVLPVASPDDRTLTDEAAKALEAFAARSRTSALLVWQAGALQFEWYADGTRPFDKVDGAGLQAGLIVLLAGQAIRDGLIPDIESPVSRWLPEWANDPRGRIAVRDLVQGTSGLAAEPPPPGADAAAWALSATLATAPGSRLAPTDVELQVLALVIGRASGRPLADHLSETLWRPMGARAGELTLDRPGGQPLAHCCVAATPRDWLRMGLLMLEGGAVEGRQVVPTAWLDAMVRPTLLSRHHGFRTTLVWPVEPKMPFAASERFVEADTVFLSGAGGQRLYVARGAELVILRLGAAPDDWDEARLPNLVARGIQMPQRPGKRIPAGQGVELPPITKPPPVPKVDTVPLQPLPKAN